MKFEPQAVDDGTGLLWDVVLQEMFGHLLLALCQYWAETASKAALLQSDAFLKKVWVLAAACLDVAYSEVSCPLICYQQASSQEASLAVAYGDPYGE
jgi:hypothetical protein